MLTLHYLSTKPGTRLTPLSRTAARPALLLALCLALMAASACGTRTAVTGKDERDYPRVEKWQPGERVEELDAVLRLVFDRPMVGTEEVGPALEKPPLRVQPAIRLQAHWDDRRSLLIRPATEWKAGQRYTFTLLPELIGPLQGPTSFVADVQPLTLQWLSPYGRNADLRPELRAHFTLPVDPAGAAGSCKLVSEGKPPVALRLADKQPRAQPGSEATSGVREVRLTVQSPLAMETRYTLQCEGLPPTAGGAPWRADAEPRTFTTHGLPRMLQGFPRPGAPLPPEQAKLCLELSTPVSREELGRAVHLSPEPEGLASSWYQDRCRPGSRNEDRANGVLLAPRTTYRVTVDADLTDEFGQKLGEAQSWTFTTGDRVPGLWTLTGAARVLEAGRPGHALGALNLDAARFNCQRFSAAELSVGFDRFSRWVDGWYDRQQASAGERARATPWSISGKMPMTGMLDLGSGANQPRTVPLDLGGLCGPKPGAVGWYALEIEPVGSSVNASGRQGDDPARLVANVTDLAVVAKRGQRSAAVWVTRLSDGSLVRGARVKVLDDAGKVLAASSTNGVGLAFFVGLPRAGRNTWFAVSHRGDLAVVGTGWRWREGLYPWQLGVRESHDNQAVQLFVHTDRGVYRPGEKVLVHGLARAVDDRAGARVPQYRDVQLELLVDDSAIFTQAGELSDFGSFHAEIALPAQIPPGSHVLKVRAAGAEHFHELTVAEFKPVTFELLGEPAASEVLAPEPARLQLDARYLYGAQVRGGEVSWTVEHEPAQVRAPEYTEFNFRDNSPALPEEEPLPAASSGIALEREDKLDKKGRARLVFDTEARRHPVRYLVTAEATDAGQDRASRSFSILAHSARHYVGARFSRWLFTGDEKLSAEVVLVDRDGHPLEGSAQLELRSTTWNCDDPENGCTARVKVLESRNLQVSAAKPASVLFDATAAGSVHLRATTRDRDGRTARASDSAWVWRQQGDGVAPYSDRVATELSADRRSYRVGQRARLALQTALAPSHFLLTAERGDVMYAGVVPRSVSTAAIELSSAYAPNVFVTMTGMLPRGEPGKPGRPRLLSGARELVVEGRSRALACELKLERDSYRPGERVRGEARVTHLGRPMEAEVALAAVNESVLQLTGFRTPDPTAVFHRPRGLDVITSSNITQVVADPALAAQVPKTARHVDQEGTDGSGGRPEVRDDYVAAAFWAPALRTDKRGRVSFEFDAPGDLSAYRLMAVVAARDDRVGSSDTRVEVRQPLSVRPLAPRFVSRGDRLQLGALVHDHSPTPGPVEVRFSGGGLQIEKGNQRIESGAGGAVVRAGAQVKDLARAWFEVEVHKGDDADRVRRSWQVRRPIDSELRVLARGREKRVEAPLRWPEGIDRELSRLEVTVDRAGLAPLAPLLATVIKYPYGCTEQTAAALSALAAAPQLAASIDADLLQPDRLAARVLDGLSRLLRARDGAGLYGAYNGLGGRVELTALVLEAILAVRDRGFKVPDQMVNDARERLSDWLSERKLEKLSARDRRLAAQSAWLLSRMGRPAKGAEKALWEARASLSADELAYLLMAWSARSAHEQRRVELSAAVQKDRPARVERDPQDPYSSRERSTALRLRALTADGSAREKQDRLASWLIERAADPAVWLSTRDIAELLSALSVWAEKKSADESQVRIGLGNKILWQGKLRGTDVASISKTAQEAGNGQVWAEATQEVTVSIRRRDLSPSRDKPAFSRGLSLTRRYLAAAGGKPSDTFALGDIVQVELSLSSERPVRMVALSDPLPAGLEPMDPALSTGSAAGCQRCFEAIAFDHLQRRDDRIDAFAEWLPAGKHTVRYLLRATTPGSFSAPAAEAEAMYLPEIHARSAVSRVTVK